MKVGAPVWLYNLTREDLRLDWCLCCQDTLLQKSLKTAERARTADLSALFTGASAI